MKLETILFELIYYRPAKGIPKTIKMAILLQIGAASAVVFTCTIDTVGMYFFNARLNCPTSNDDSYWIKVDNGSFVTINGLGTSGWQWLRLTNANLAVGTHTFTVAYREDGAKLDKLLVTTSSLSVDGLGFPATNCGQVRTQGDKIISKK